MCNAMFAIKGRNAIIIAPHPKTKKVNKYVVDSFRDILVSLGAPADAIQTIEEPSLDLTDELMASVDVVIANRRRLHGKSRILQRKTGTGCWTW